MRHLGQGRPHLLGERECLGCGPVALRIAPAQFDAASFGDGEARFGALADEAALLLGQLEVQQKRIGVGAKLGDDERRLVLHQPADEVDIPAQAIQLAHNHRTAVLASGLDRGGKLRSAVERVRTLACLHLSKCSGDLEALRLGEPGYGLDLRFTWLGSNEMKAVMEKSGVLGSPSIRFAAAA